ncbi:hypothetical protein [uncultured Sphingomonas sp.]|uniref:hypothetical protein n=1 Tax=uncultured Sphingomonas sp. TaxID=158754 RepID=UPI0025E49BA7|nr:hypothetical protein [uncultured Sphingomonas sp.]
MADEIEKLKSRIDDLESALGTIAGLEVRAMGMGDAVQLTHVQGVLDAAKSIAAEALTEDRSDGGR